MSTSYKCFEYLLNGEWERAIDCLTQAIEFDPSDASAFVNRGVAKSGLRRYESAIPDFDLAINLDQNNARAFLNRGIAKGELHHYESALSDFDRAIELDPNKALSFANRGAAKGELHHYESALSDFDRAIELDPNNVDVFFNRGFVKFNLHRYESALSDYDRAIELDPEMSLPYFGKAQALWKGLDELGNAQHHFNRFLFLAKPEKIIKNWKVTHDFYSRHTTAPFLLYRLFEMLPSLGDFLTLQETLHETECQCRTLKNYLQHQRNTGESERDTPQFYRLEALVQYFMGDPLMAYGIYDEVLDEELECLDLMDSYYYLLSAAEFLEPNDSILHFALKQADEYLGGARAEENERELYYAGQLHTLGGVWEKAFEAFGRAQAFFPAVVMQAVAAERLDKPEKDIEALWEKAKQLVNVLPLEAGINGFPKIRLELGREDYLEPFLQYAHYREIAEHLHRFREDSAPFHTADFCELWQLSPTDEQEIGWQLRKKELEHIEAELQSYFTQNLETQYADYKPEELQNLEKLLSEKDKAVQAAFEKLKTKSAIGSEALEHQFGLEIDGWQLRHPHTYGLMLKYFFLSKMLAPKATFYLYFYNDFKATEKQKDYSTSKAAYTKGAQKFFEIILKPVWMLGVVGLAAVAAALAELSRQFFLQNPTGLDEEDVISNYQKFKIEFLKFLSIEMESNGRENFFTKYPLEGWEDWKN